MSKKTKIQAQDLSKAYRALKNAKPALSKTGYPCSLNAHTGNAGTGMVKTAGSGVIYGQPQFFSPVHTPINWQIPSKRKEIYQWCRFYFMNEPKVASALDFYSLFPMNSFELECKNRYVKRYYEKLVENLDLSKWLKIISHEAYLLGDCFPFLEIKCDTCGGSGVNPQGQICEHEGGEYKRIVVLNPEYVEVFSNPMLPDLTVALLPDEELMALVSKRGPGYNKLSPKVKSMIMSGKPIPLDNRNVSHIKFGESGYNKYGISIIRRLFPVLAYKTKLMTAQWIVAERLILPIKVVKVGSETRPAGPAEIADIQAQLAQTANDPNLTLVTHHAFDLEWYGASGKVLQVQPEYEHIDQEILDGLMINKALLNGEGPCYHPDVEILTEEGWKHYYEVNDGEKLATFNPKNNSMEFQHFKNRIIKQYDGDLVQFKTNKIEMLTTTNHRMWLQERTSKDGKDAYSEWKVVPAEEVKYRSKFRSCVDDWSGEIPSRYEDGVQVGKYLVNDLKAFSSFAGYYISEGWANYKQAGIAQKTNSSVTIKIREYLKATGVHFNEIPQKLKKDTEDEIKATLKQLSETNNDPSFVFTTSSPSYESFTEAIENTSVAVEERKIDEDGMTLFNFGKDVAVWLMENIPGKAKEKRIPKWIRNLPKEYLSTLLEALLDGDGCLHKNSKDATPYNSYITSSKELADDVMEISMKLGYSSWISYCREEEGIYVVCIPSSEIGKFPVLDSLIYGKTTQDRKKCISRIPYKGTVWCFEVPNEFLVVRMNGKPLICGNTYSNAAIGIEAMIDRLESWRQEIKHWVEQKIFMPVAKMKGFVEKNEWGELEYIFPRLKWGIMHLRDQQNYRQFMLQLFEKGVISTKRLLETFDINHDEEIEWIRFERMTGQTLQPQQPGGAGGGMGGGFGGAPGGGGGELGGLGELGGAPGGSPGGAPGAEGGAAGMGAPGGAPAPAQSDVANISQFGGRALKKDKREKILKQKEQLFKQYEKSQLPQDVMRDQKGRVMFTGPEREVMRELLRLKKDGTIKYSIYPQYEVKHGSQAYTIDFAMPQLMLGVEVDGYIFHSSDEQKQSDKERDAKLASHGWTIIRFTDEEIDSKLRLVMETIINYIFKKEKELKDKNK